MLTNPDQLIDAVALLHRTLKFQRSDVARQFAEPIKVQTEIRNQIAIDALDAIDLSSAKSRTIGLHDLDRYHTAKNELKRVESDRDRQTVRRIVECLQVERMPSVVNALILILGDLAKYGRFPTDESQWANEPPFAESIEVDN